MISHYELKQLYLERSNSIEEYLQGDISEYTLLENFLSFQERYEENQKFAESLPESANEIKIIRDDGGYFPPLEFYIKHPMSFAIPPIITEVPPFSIDYANTPSFTIDSQKYLILDNCSLIIED